MSPEREQGWARRGHTHGRDIRRVRRDCPYVGQRGPLCGEVKGQLSHVDERPPRDTVATVPLFLSDTSCV